DVGSGGVDGRAHLVGLADVGDDPVAVLLEHAAHEAPEALVVVGEHHRDRRVVGHLFTVGRSGAGCAAGRDASPLPDPADPDPRPAQASSVRLPCGAAGSAAAPAGTGSPAPGPRRSAGTQPRPPAPTLLGGT